ncbi:MAG TPA: nodulation protein NfeD [Ktedonobacteraceae bacterium]|nr:nodulation protein NfeD [Ktedonobacteraceae bacterium]
MFSRHGHARRLLLLLLSSLIVVVVSLFFTASARVASAASPHIDVTTLNSEISPASLSFLKQAITTAEGDGAQVLVIEVNTPGGDLASMRSMTEAELNSTVPIVTYVTPSGGFAASAGAFVTLAAPIAAMAPTTRIGASSPITSTGADIGSTLKAKLENDLVALITGIQKRYGRNVPLATAMVTQAASYDDVTAYNKQLIDLRATSLGDLLNQVDGRTVKLVTGPVTLHTAGLHTQMLEPGPFDYFYSFLLDPNVIFLLFIVAMIGIYLEISHPGAMVPGVAGGIALVLFLFAVGSITPNWAGLALMVLAFVLLVLDLRLPTHGVLTIGAIMSLIFGSLLFFNSGGPYGGAQVNPIVVYIMAGVIGLISFALIALIVRAQRRPVTTGMEGMIGAKAVALTPLLPEGRVRYGGEDWSAVLDDPAESADAGSEVRVVAVEGLRLRVQAVRYRPAAVDEDVLSNTSLE